MSIQIVKKGISDSIQDHGRYGYQHIGIQPNGCMDFFSARLGNYLLGNPLHTAVFELYFPTSIFNFSDSYTICITGANFVPVINEKSIELNTPIKVNANDTLQFLKPLEGKIAYLTIQGKIQNEPWLNSESFFSKRVQTGDFFNVVPLPIQPTPTKSIQLENIQYIRDLVLNPGPIRIIPGPAWNDLSPHSVQQFLNSPFHSTLQSNRMGYCLKGPQLALSNKKEYLSSAVTRGTLQLLPSGEVIVLMADHQTIGGYPNLGQIILVDLPRFAQLNNDSSFHFSLTNVQHAHQLYQSVQSRFSN